MELFELFSAILTVMAVYFAVKIAKKAMKIIFSLIAIAGIAMTLYGDQIRSFAFSVLKNYM